MPFKVVTGREFGKKLQDLWSLPDHLTSISIDIDSNGLAMCTARFYPKRAMLDKLLLQCQEYKLIPVDSDLDRAIALIRRWDLLQKSELTDEDELELRSLNAEIGPLPLEKNPEDAAAIDIIRRAAEVLESNV